MANAATRAARRANEVVLTMGGVNSGKATKNIQTKAKTPTELKEREVVCLLKSKKTFDQIRDETGVSHHFISRIRKENLKEIEAFYAKNDRLLNEALEKSLEDDRQRLISNIQKSGLLVEKQLDAALEFYDKGKPEELFETTAITEGKTARGSYKERRKEPPLTMSDLIKIRADLMKNVFAINEDNRKSGGDV